MAGASKLMILEDQIITSMASNPTFVNEFPFLKSVATAGKAKPGCTPCQQRANSRIRVYSSVKQSLVSMGAERKARLKKMLNAEKVRVRIASNGKVVDYTF